MIQAIISWIGTIAYLFVVNFILAGLSVNYIVFIGNERIRRNEKME